MKRDEGNGTRGQVHCPGLGRERVAGTGTLTRLEWFIFIKKKGSDGDVYDEGSC